MKKIIVLFVFCLMSCVSSYAEASPKEVLKTLIERMKKTGDASPVVDYVYWEDAFAKLTSEQKEQMKLTDSTQMKEYFRQVLKDPAAVLKQRFEAQKDSMPQDRRDAMEKALAQIAQSIKSQEQERKNKLKNTNYTIGEETVSGDTAKVKLSRVYNGESKDTEVRFVKVGDKWLLPSLETMEGGGTSEGAKEAPNTDTTHKSSDVTQSEPSKTNAAPAGK